MSEIFASILDKILDKSLFPKILFSAICAIVVKLLGVSDIWLLSLVFISALFILLIIPLWNAYLHKRKVLNQEKRQRQLEQQATDKKRVLIESAITEYYKNELSTEAKSCIYLLTQMGRSYGQENTYVIKDLALVNLITRYKQEFSFVLNSQRIIELITIRPNNAIYTFYINFDILLNLVKQDEDTLKQFISCQTSH